MQAKKRYLLLISCCAFLSIGYIGFHHWKENLNSKTSRSIRSSFLNFKDLVEDEDVLSNPRERLRSQNNVEFANCRMENCFDFSRCEKSFKVYVYPVEENVQISSSYQKVLRTIENSNYYTTDPSQACIFILGLDTLDRDNLSKDYVRNMPSRIQKLSLWNSGQNHIIFTLYTGTFPDYTEDLGFDSGKAILAKASSSNAKFRVGFDISLPLFHKTHPEKGGDMGTMYNNQFPNKKQYLLAFKGKRYVYGIGSETRNSLYHLHNERDIVLVTTCRHGESWKGYKDERCDHDNEEYDSYDYQVLLKNSSFCLVPRGRRLASFRFLETLQTWCIPVLLANGWELPFAEVIDWNKAAIWADERLLLQVPDTLRTISATKQLQMRQQTQIIWNQYFSSVEKIILSSLDIVYDRVHKAHQRSLMVWNTDPGSLNLKHSFSDHLHSFPFFYELTGSQPRQLYTAVIYVSTGWSGSINSSPLYKLIKNITKSKFVEKIFIIWNCARYPAPSENRLPTGNIPLLVLPGNKSITDRYQFWKLIETDAVFSLDEDASLTTEEFDFAYNVWRSFPDRIVGYSARTHYWSHAKEHWTYSSHWDNSFSIILTGAAIYHKYYQYAYTTFNSVLLETLDNFGRCDDLLLNFIVADISQRPPIKLSQRKQIKENIVRRRLDRRTLDQNTNCLNVISQHFGKMPLLSSNLRLDPVLFKDKVSVQRKKYRQIETIIN